MNSLTKHTLKQVEWFNRLQSAYNCSFVEMEYRFYGKLRADVFGKTSNGEIFIVEIGSLNQKKMHSIKSFVEKAYSEKNQRTKVFLVDFKSLSGRIKIAGKEKRRCDKFLSFPFVKVI